MSSLDSFLFTVLFSKTTFSTIYFIMRIIYVNLLLLFFCNVATAQTTLVGRWYSGDSSRIYKIYESGENYEAILDESKRQNEKPGELILGSLAYNHRRKIYKGFIRAVSDGMTAQVKVRIKDDGKTLKLKLRRMMLFPVYLQWKKVS